MDKCKCRITHIEVLCNAIQAHGQISGLHFRNTNLLRTGSIHLSNCLQNIDSLVSLSVVEAGLADKGITELS